MTQSVQEQELTELIAPAVDALGYRLLWLEMKGGVLSLYCENPQTERITLDECGQVSRKIAALLDETDPIEGTYQLEVSSPGIDRPLFTEADYAHFKGLEAKVELDAPIDPETAQRRYRGTIEGVENNMVQLDCAEGGKVTLPLNKITKAKLVMSDALIKATKPEVKQSV